MKWIKLEKAMDQNIFELSQTLGHLLKEKQLILATAESCTGGALSKAVTDIPGASDWFNGGLITYSNIAKQQLLQIPESLLIEKGAVSKEVAQAMVSGVLANSDANIAIAVTGIAGPAGGSKEKPIGTVWFAFGLPKGQVEMVLKHFDGNRLSIRKQSVKFALEKLIELLENI